jgi:isovaleryl-CoA dehydrogenase
MGKHFPDAEVASFRWHIYLSCPVPAHTSFMPKPTFLALTHPTSIVKRLVQTTKRTFTHTPQLTMRVPYAPAEPPTEDARPVYERIAARRNPRPLIPLDLALLHNPSVADGWSSFIGAIRTKTTVPEGLKELAISRIAALNGAVHEWDVHAALALKAGISSETMQVVLEHPFSGRGNGQIASSSLPALEGLEKLSPEERAVVRYTDQMTIGVSVEDDVAASVKEFLSDTQVVELTATVAAYNCVSRFLVALDVGECNGRGLKKVEELGQPH